MPAKIIDEFIGECSSPLEELRRIAHGKQVSPDELDFDILNAFTYLKTEEDEIYREADHNVIPELYNAEFALNPNLRIKQKYAIKIRNKKDDPDFKLVAEFKSDPTKSDIFAIIKPESKLTHTPELEQKILQELNTMKAKRGLLVGLYAKEMKSRIVELVALLKHKHALTESFSIPICRAFPPVLTVDATIKYLYREYAQERSREECCTQRQNEYSAVPKDALVMEFLKPRTGKPGRNCKGEFVDAEEPKSEQISPVSVDSSIRQEESDEKVSYYANRGGYVIFGENTLRIEEELTLEQLSCSSTGNVIAGVDTGARLRVTKEDSMSESICEGIHVEVSELTVQGNIGRNVEIRTRECTIRGQTHQSSKIFSEQANINVHKGYLKAKEATIERLENGEVLAEQAIIYNAMGGVVKAREIIIKSLYGHARLFASDYIEIETLKGEENKITIDPEAYFGDGYKIEDLEEKIHALEEEVRHEERQIRENIASIQKSNDAIQAAKQQINLHKSKGTKPPLMLIHKVREFAEFVSRTKAIKAEYDAKRKELESLRSKIDDFSGMTADAKITNIGNWMGHNVIKFIMLNPRREFTYIPKGSEHTLRLVEEDDGTYVIKATA